MQLAYQLLVVCPQKLCTSTPKTLVFEFSGMAIKSRITKSSRSVHPLDRPRW